jgi:hypothetical protein
VSASEISAEDINAVAGNAGSSLHQHGFARSPSTIPQEKSAPQRAQVLIADHAPSQVRRHWQFFALRSGSTAFVRQSCGMRYKETNAFAIAPARPRIIAGPAFPTPGGVLLCKSVKNPSGSSPKSFLLLASQKT